MTPEQLKTRTKGFGLEIIALVADLPGTRVAQVIGNQLLRSGTAVGSNYRATCRARSSADFRSKLAVVEEEADETLYWLELLAESRAATDDRLPGLLREADELVAIFTAARRTARRHGRLPD